MVADKNRTKEVLERLKSQESVPKPKSNQYSKKEMSASDRAANSQSIYQIKLEKIINRLNDLERKMQHGEDYFTHYWDYSKVSKEFMDVVKEFEKFDTSYIPTQFKKKVEDTRKKVEAQMNRKMPEKEFGKKFSAEDFINK